MGEEGRKVAEHRKVTGRELRRCEGRGGAGEGAHGGPLACTWAIHKVVPQRAACGCAASSGVAPHRMAENGLKWGAVMGSFERGGREADAWTRSK